MGSHWHPSCIPPNKQTLTLTWSRHRQAPCDTTGATATEPVLFEKAEARQEQNRGVSYAYLALGDYSPPPVAVEHERAADGKINIVARDGALLSLVGSSSRAFAARAA